MKNLSKKRFGQNFINDVILLGDLVDLIKVKKRRFFRNWARSGKSTSLIEQVQIVPQ